MATYLYLELSIFHVVYVIRSHLSNFHCRIYLLTYLIILIRNFVLKLLLYVDS